MKHDYAFIGNSTRVVPYNINEKGFDTPTQMGNSHPTILTATWIEYTM